MITLGQRQTENTNQMKKQPNESLIHIKYYSIDIYDEFVILCKFDHINQMIPL
jgi:hypothetical protein